MLILFSNKLDETKKQTDEEFWAEEIEKAKAHLNEFEYGSGDYNVQLQSISELQIEREKAKTRENRKEKKEIPWTAIAGMVAALGSFAIGMVNAGVKMEEIQATKRGQDIQQRGQDIQLQMGKIAYLNEQEYKACNNKVWNQAGRVK